MKKRKTGPGDPILPIDYEALAHNNCRILGELLDGLSAALKEYSISYGKFLEVYRELGNCCSPKVSHNKELNWHNRIIVNLGEMKVPRNEIERALEILGDNNTRLLRTHEILETLFYADLADR